MQLDVVAWIQVMYKNDAGETAMSSMCATVIPFSSGDTRVTTIDTTGRIYAPGYTPEHFRICLATHKKGTQIDQAVTAGWYAFHNLKVSRTTTEGGSFTVTGSNGYIADLSSGVLRLSYKSGNDTQQFFDMANTRCYSSKDNYKWYATMAAQDYTLSGKTSAGFKFGTSTEDTKEYVWTDTTSTDPHADLSQNWFSTFALLEADAMTIRKQVVTNPYGFNVFAGLLHHRYVGGKDHTVGVGIGAPYGTASAALELTDVDAKTILARLDLYQPRAGEVTLRLTTSDNKTAFLFVNNDGLYAQFGSNKAKLLAGKDA